MRTDVSMLRMVTFIQETTYVAKTLYVSTFGRSKDDYHSKFTFKDKLGDYMRDHMKGLVTEWKTDLDGDNIPPKHIDVHAKPTMGIGYVFFRITFEEQIHRCVSILFDLNQPKKLQMVDVFDVEYAHEERFRKMENEYIEMRHETLREREK